MRHIEKVLPHIYFRPKAKRPFFTSFSLCLNFSVCFSLAAYKTHASCISNVTDASESTCNKTCAQHIDAAKNFTGGSIREDFPAKVLGKQDGLNSFLNETCQ